MVAPVGVISPSGAQKTSITNVTGVNNNINNANMNKGNVQNQLYKKVMEDNITSSLGFYSKEQINYRKRDVCSSAKERYYSSLTATNPIFLDYESDKKSQKPLFTSEKISKYDDSKVEYKKDSRTFLYDNLYSNKVFPTNKVRIK